MLCYGPVGENMNVAQTGLADVKEKEKTITGTSDHTWTESFCRLTTAVTEEKKDKRLHSSRKHAQASEGFLLPVEGDAASQSHTNPLSTPNVCRDILINYNPFSVRRNTESDKVDLFRDYCLNAALFL